MTTLAAPHAAAADAPRAPGPLTLWAVAGGAAAAVACTFVVSLTADDLAEPVVRASLVTWLSLPYVLSGMVAWWRRPESRLGPLLIVAGFVTFASGLAVASVDVLFTFGQALDLLPPALLLHVFLAFPSGVLRAPFDRGLVLAAYAAGLGLQLLVLALDGFGRHNLLAIASHPAAAERLQQIQLLSLSALALAGVVVLVVRRRREGRPLRRSLALLVDSFAFALVMIAVLFLSHLLGSPVIEETRWATFAFVGLAPVAFLIGLLDARLARSAVGDLVVALRGEPAPRDLRDALARALRDPSLVLAYWLPDFGTYADLDGRPVELPGPGEGRATTPIDRDGAHVAALVHDPALEDEAELLAAVTAAAGIALENGRLHAELRARVEELRGSRARIVDASQSERKRLERDLHDGAQQRLIALSLELGLLERQADPDSSKRLERARREIAASLEELRAIARGIHPAVVSGHGLEVALEQLVARASVPVRLEVDVASRLPERLEVAAFYLVSESLANVAKHARATSVSVEVRRWPGSLLVEIVDDGVGGADTERGSGLRGLADRVEALGGRLRVWSPAGGGTRVRAEIPCGS